MFRTTCVIVIVTIVAILFSQRYQTQREERAEATRLQLLESELRLPPVPPSSSAAAADELDDYCDAICKLHDCPFGQQDLRKDDACLCYDYSQQICEFAAS
ncbi:hypothetical protein TYRP_009926 [Tyrophagus putrescentiae]|nr:hypothetical protein TYRP_009926 [Tyrophagus putrescentiae]